MLKAVFFDLDGTLLYMDEPKFLEIYFDAMARFLNGRVANTEKFVEATKVGTRAMFKNDGSLTNEEVFWRGFEGYFGRATREEVELMDAYYDRPFEETFVTCKPNPYSYEIVKFCREAGLKVILSTNPLFPRIATVKRMAISGLREEDFDLVTTFENSSFCKPNPEYFIELMRKFSLSADEVIVFGNNTFDDGECAVGAGLKCYIIESENLIENEKSTHSFERIQITDVINTVKKHMQN